MTAATPGPAMAVGVRVRGGAVSARLVEPTGFGRWAIGSRRAADDLDLPMGVSPGGADVLDAWMGSVANVVERLLFGLESTGPVAVGVAVDEVGSPGDGGVRPLEPEGLAIEGGAALLERALGCRSIRARTAFMGAPIAWAHGEIRSSLGALTSAGSEGADDGGAALLVHWDRAVDLVGVTGGGEVRSLGASGHGFLGLEELLRRRGQHDAQGRLLSRVRQGDDAARAALADAALGVGEHVARAIGASEDEGRPVDRVVLAGDLGRACLDGRIGGIALDRIGEALADGWPPLHDGGLMVSREEAACLIGAAAQASERAPTLPPSPQV